MLIVIPTTNYTATGSLARYKGICCENCKTFFFYKRQLALERKVTELGHNSDHQTTKKLRKLKQSIHEELEEEFKTKDNPVRCPSCNHLQENMIASILHDTRRRVSAKGKALVLYLFLTFPAFGCLGIYMFGLVSVILGFGIILVALCPAVVLGFSYLFGQMTCVEIRRNRQQSQEVHAKIQACTIRTHTANEFLDLIFDNIATLKEKYLSVLASIPTTGDQHREVSFNFSGNLEESSPTEQIEEIEQAIQILRGQLKMVAREVSRKTWSLEHDLKYQIEFPQNNICNTTTNTNHHI